MVGYGCAGRLWDLRSGHSIMVLESHVKGILSMDFSPNGYQMCAAPAALFYVLSPCSVCTKGNCCTVLPLESLQCLYQRQLLHAHARLAVCPGRVTGSEDHTARVWDLRKRKSLYTLAAHSSLVSQACLPSCVLIGSHTKVC